MIDEEKLILLVQKYACLYDISSSHYSDQQRKNSAWDEISRIISCSGKCVIYLYDNQFYIIMLVHRDVTYLLILVILGCIIGISYYSRNKN